MAAATFANTSFEIAGPNSAEPSDWTAAFSLVALDHARWDFGPTEKPWEDFECGWPGLHHTTLLSRAEPFALIDGTSIQVSINAAPSTPVVFNAVDFADISEATASEVAAVITTALGGVGFGDVDDDRVLLRGLVESDTVAVVGPVTDANDVLGFPYVRTEPRVLVSVQEPFALVDGMDLALQVWGGLERIVFRSADFADISSASAAEVADVINAAASPPAAAVVEFGRVVVRSNPYGGEVLVVGMLHESTANAVLGFPRPYNAFVAEGIDIIAAVFSGAVYENFEVQYAGLAAQAWTANKAPFNVSNGDTLHVQIDLQPAQIVVFAGIAVPGAATAQEIADNLTAQLVSPQATASNVADLEVRLQSDYVGPGSGVLITAGTAQAALNFTPSTGMVIAGNETYLDVLPSSTAALFNTTPFDTAYESFEREWSGNEQFVWILTTDFVEILGATEGDKFTLTIARSTYMYTVGAVDVPASVATNLAAKITNDANALVSATPVGARINITRLDNRTRLDPFTISVTPTTTPFVDSEGAAVVGSEATSGSLSPAQFDTADAEDFEDGWQNDAWAWQFTDNVLRVLTATVGQEYVVEYGPDYDRRSVSYTAILGDDVDAIASALRTELVADTDLVVGAVSPPGGIPVAGAGTFHLNVKAPNDGGLTQWESATLSALLDPAEFGTDGAPNDFEAFEVVLDYQLYVELTDPDPQPAGLYAFVLNGVAIEYDSPGEGSAAVLAALANAIAVSALKDKAEGVVLSATTLGIRSTTCPREELGAANPSAPAAIAVKPVPTNEYWTNLALMCSI